MNIARWLLLALLSLPILEIYLLIKLIGLLGFVLTLALLLSAAALGMFLLRTQGLSTWVRVQQALAQGELPAREMVESGLLAIGGLLLLIPGFLTDLLALPCLIPVTRRHLADYLLKNYIPMPPRAGESDGQLTIEGEFRREK
jgi:UPF0716 protein FxsA